MSEGIDPPVTIEDNEHVMDSDDNEHDINSGDTNDVKVLQSELVNRQHILSNWQLNSIGGFEFSDKTKVNPFSLEAINKMVNDTTKKNDNNDNKQDEQNIIPTISGADIYSTVVRKKRKRSPTKIKKTLTKDIKQKEEHTNATTTKNRFSIFNLVNNSRPNGEKEKVILEKPTPFHIRGEKNTEEIRKWMSELQITNYDIKVLFRGHEAKLQAKTIEDYRKIQNFFEQNKVPNYTYQLKSARSVRAVIKGLDPRIESVEIKNALNDLNFKPRNVFKVKNKNGYQSSVTLIELEPTKESAKTHPIFDLKRLLNMVITVEEPKKNNQPKQCFNCQEYGHTKNRCFLAPICAICSDKHLTNQCDKDKNDKSAKLCNNCGENHTANWKGCKVYQVLLERLNPKQRREQRTANNIQRNKLSTANQFRDLNVIKGTTYANVVSGKVNNDESVNVNDLVKLMFAMQTNMQALQSNISEMITKQNMLENSIMAINETLNKISKRK